MSLAIDKRVDELTTLLQGNLGEASAGSLLERDVIFAFLLPMAKRELELVELLREHFDPANDRVECRYCGGSWRHDDKRGDRPVAHNAVCRHARAASLLALYPEE